MTSTGVTRENMQMIKTFPYSCLIENFCLPGLGLCIGLPPSFHGVFLRWIPHPVIVAIKDKKDNIRALIYSYYITITGWGGPPKVLLRTRVGSGS